MKLDTKLLYKKAADVNRLPSSELTGLALRDRRDVMASGMAGLGGGSAGGGLVGGGLGALYTALSGDRGAEGRKKWMRNILVGAMLGGGAGAAVGGIGLAGRAFMENRESRAAEAELARRYGVALGISSGAYSDGNGGLIPNPDLSPEQRAEAVARAEKQWRNAP